MPKTRVGVFHTQRSLVADRLGMKRRLHWPWLLGSVALVACAARPPSADAAVSPPNGRAQPASAPPEAAASRLTPVPLAAASASPASLRSEPLEVKFERVLTGPIGSIALGEGSRIAALGDEPYVGDARRLRALPLPSSLRAKPGERDELRIFFGRDNEPRIMGTRRSSSREVSIYWRHTAGVWRDGREEIGQLGGNTRGGLWGVLGSADPELVCRAGAQCIIKRSSGWTTAPAGSAPRLVALQNGVLWGLDDAGLANIDGKGWSVVLPAPAWSAPRAFWASAGEAWVAAERGLYHYRERAWAEEPAPIAEPAAFWGTRPDSIWVAGRGGAAHFDGRGWRRLSLAGPLDSVVGRGDGELWFGGEAGLVYVQP